MPDHRRDPIHESLENGILLVDALATADLSDAAREATARHDFPDHLTLDELRTAPRAAATAMAAVIGDRRLIEEILGAVANRRPVDLGADTPPRDVGELHSRSRRDISQVLGTLAAYQERVVRRRFGINCHRATLREIGDDSSLTTDRVKQVEAKALRRLRHPTRVRVFQRHLDMMQASIVDRARDGTNFVSEDRMERVFADLDPMTRLAAAVFGEKAASLVWNGDPVEGGWYVDGRDPRVRSRLMGAFLERIAELPFPRPLSTLVPHLPGGSTVEDAAGWLLATKGWRLEGGYVFQGDRRLLPDVRAARVHALLSREGRSVVAGNVVSDAYRDAFPGDSTGPGSSFHRLGSVPHLFEKVGSTGIAPVCLARSGPPMGPDWSTEATEPADWRDPASGHAVVSAALERGPLALEVIADACGRTSPADTRIDPVPILGLYDAFVKYAPGVWARRDRAALPEGAILPGRMADGDAVRRYAVAAHGGCGRGFFPGWTADHERRLVQAASRLGDPDLMASLLLVCDPSTWPAPERTKALWGDAKERTQAWRIGTPAPSLGRRFPDPTTVVACLAFVVERGGIGAFAVNDIAGTKIDSLGAADTLAFLTAMGAVDATRDWQAQHRATPVAGRLLRELCDEAASIGRLDWTGGAPRKMLDAASSFVSCSVWFDDDALRKTIAAEIGEVVPRRRPENDVASTYAMNA